MSHDFQQSHSEVGSRNFPVTRLSVVERAKQGDVRSLDFLMERYRSPIIGYLRMIGKSPEDAEDLVQDFYLQLHARNKVANYQPERGKFRTFLLSNLKQNVIDRYHFDHAQKRQGGREHCDLDVVDREQVSGAFFSEAERKFDEDYLHQVLERAEDAVGEEFGPLMDADGRTDETRRRFEAMRPYLWRHSAKKADLDMLKDELDMSFDNVKVTLHRLRTRFREVFRAEVRETVETEEEFNEELGYFSQLMVHS